MNKEKIEEAADAVSTTALLSLLVLICSAVGLWITLINTNPLEAGVVIIEVCLILVVITQLIFASKFRKLADAIEEEKKQ